MTPKEKAKGLVGKYHEVDFRLHIPANYEIARQCALIYVNELLDMLWMFSDSINGQSAYNEYQQVKEELEKISK